jgi:glycosyltransferase involved in cell wall biosynthesis
VTHSIAHVAVIIPARDEASRIGRALHAVAEARRRLPAGVSSSCVVVADTCRDATAAIVRAASRPGVEVHVIEHALANVGLARRLGTLAALRAAPAPPRAVWLANTDADTVVPRTWLADQLALAADGAIAVAGTVTLDEDAPAALLARFRATYTTHPDGTHPHVHGANLGVRADAYVAAGGWPPLRTGEDHALWRRLRRHGPLSQLAEPQVVTSARRRGRAPDGFAADLVALDVGASEPAALGEAVA